MKSKIVSVLFFLLLIVNADSAQTKEVKVEFSLLDEAGNFINSLKDSDILVSTNKVSSLKLKSDNALDVIMMIDTSASQEKTLPLEKKAAENFIDTILDSKKDRVSIVTFTGKVALEQDLTADFAKAKEQIRKIEFEPPAGYIGGGIVAGGSQPSKSQILQGSTSLWSSVNQVLEAFSKTNSSNSRKTIILITDGINTYGNEKLKDAVKLSNKLKITVQAIGIGDENYDGVDEKNLKKIAEETGGVAIVPKKDFKNFPNELKFIAQSLRSNYEAIFTPASLNLKDKAQELKVEVVNPELRKLKLRVIQPNFFYTQE